MADQPVLKRLFSPIQINRTEIRNRLVLPAMHLGYTPGGSVSDRLIAFYRERAAGGVGMIIIGGCTIDEYSGLSDMIGIHDDRFIEGLAQLAKSVQDQGARLFAQLYQAGRYAHSLMIGGKTPLAPSAVRSKLTGETPKAMDLDEIEMVQKSFVKAALRAQKAGLDGVEVLGSAGYLISQFLSPVTNKREDQYGGPFENRLRFGREVLEKIRKAVGPDYPLLVRIAGNDFMPGGNTNKEAVLFAQTMEAAGADLLNVTGGWHETRVPQLTMMVPQGAFTYLAQGVRRSVTIPVIACNRINDPFLAERILQNDQADMIGMARALIADPELPKKAVSGNVKAIRHCIACNQGCFDSVFQAWPITCLVNPRAGLETHYPTLPTDRKKKVLVIGGGPAGMTAALTAAQRGHEVVLLEKKSAPGGQLLLAAAPPGREEMATAAFDLINHLKATSVTIHLGAEATPEVIKTYKPEVLVVATGAKPIIPPIPGVAQPHVYSAWEILSDHKEVKSPVVIIGGGAVGCETALFLAKTGTINAETLMFLFENQAETPEVLSELILKGNKEITIVEMLSKIGKDIGQSTRWSILQDIHRRGIQVQVSSKVIEITPDSVIFEKDGNLISLPAKTVIIAAGAVPENSLYEQVKDMVPEIHLIGDAKTPRKALEAVREGFLVGLEI